MSLVWWILTPIAVLIGLYIVLGVYLSMVLKWEDEQSVGLRYYGLPPAGRDAFKRTLARHARLLAPLLWLNAKLARMDFRRVGFQYKGVAAPHGSCSPETFARAEAY
nr:hypothetical protein [Gemmatimonadales bacterium]